MPEIRTVRTARIAHRCGSDTGTRCRTTIQPGDRYLLASLPPNSEVGNSGWWHLKVCQGCATQYGQTLDEQVTPRHTPAPLETVPSRPFRDEPNLHRTVRTVRVPALTA